jgi:hypothetical protein
LGPCLLPHSVGCTVSPTHFRFITNSFDKALSKKNSCTCIIHLSWYREALSQFLCYCQLCLNSMHPEHSQFFLISSHLGTIYLQIPRVYCAVTITGKRHLHSGMRVKKEKNIILMNIVWPHVSLDRVLEIPRVPRPCSENCWCSL